MDTPHEGRPVVDDEANDGVEPEIVESEDVSAPAIQDPFDPTTISIDTKFPVVHLITKRIAEQEIDLNPDFQRNPGIWDSTRQSRLIESLLLRIPIPVFYMAADRDDKWQVVDGLQRLDTLKSFIHDNTLRLRRLEYLKQFEGLLYKELPRAMQRRIDETQLSCHIIQPGTPPEVMYNVFKRINTGGKPLSPQEIRHALNPGPARAFINTLAQDDAFLQATRRSISPRRMADRECVLRFVAFHQRFDAYKGKLDDFLVQMMRSLNSDMDDSLRTLLRRDFRSAMHTATALFGTDAFRKPRRDQVNQNSPINKPLFESWSVNLARLDEAHRQRLTERQEAVAERFALLMRDENFVESISTGTQWKRQVHTRFGRIQELLSEVLA